MFDFCFCFFPVYRGVFGIAGFQAHFSYISKPTFFHWGSKCTRLVLLCVCVWFVVCFLTVPGDPFITRLIVFSMAFSGAVQNTQYSSVCRIWCKDSSTYTLLGIKYKFPWKGPVFVVFICLHKLEWSVLWNLGAGNWRKLEWNLHFFLKHLFPILQRQNLKLNLSSDLILDFMFILLIEIQKTYLLRASIFLMGQT